MLLRLTKSMGMFERQGWWVVQDVVEAQVPEAHPPTKKGSNPKWEREEAHYAMPVHTRVHQVLTVALLDHDSNGDDEIGRYLSFHTLFCRCCVCSVSAFSCWA